MADLALGRRRMSEVTVNRVLGVDAHVHLLRAHAPLTAERHSQPPRDTSVSELLAVLDAHRLSHAVLTAPSFYGCDNEILLGALDEGEGRLLGTVSVPTDIDALELHRLADRGVRGVRLNWLARRRRPDATTVAYRRLFERAAGAGLHIEVLIEPAHLAGVMEPVLEAGAELVIDHMGLLAGADGRAADAVRTALRAGHTWMKLSAPYRLPDRAQAATVARMVSGERPDRVLWGSDWPWVSHADEGFVYGETLGWLRAWISEPDVRRAALVTNPAELLGLPADTRPSCSAYLPT